MHLMELVLEVVVTLPERFMFERGTLALLTAITRVLPLTINALRRGEGDPILPPMHSHAFESSMRSLIC